ncbi:MAG: hypothetical protein Q7V88_14265 [Actinomycetota bacterium]|nr:hypothetical protein [Actinomycetota bacterium]
MTSPQHTGWFSGRTRLITVISIIAVGIAGATAVSANVGILNSSADSSVGNVSASDLTADTQVVDVYLDQLTTTTVIASPATGVQEFAVDVAGTVAVAATDTGIRLDSATPAAGWTWSLAQTSSTELMVTFTDGTRTFEFIATLNADGTIAASVNEPIITPAAPATGGGYEGDDGDEHEGGDDDD